MMTKTLAANTQNVFPPTSTTSSNRTSENSESSIGSGSNVAAGSERDLFMTLLVAQLKHQDPLAPQDGTAFVAQLAQFNSLDQLVGIRQSIEQLTAQLQQTNHDTNTQEKI